MVAVGETPPPSTPPDETPHAGPPRLWLPHIWLPKLRWPHHWTAWRWLIRIWTPDTPEPTSHPNTRLLFALGLLVTWLVNSALPGFGVPTLGQALWTAAFGISQAHDGVFSLYAHNFGVPTPMPAVFGLTGARPVGWLVGLGLQAVDAYAAVLALWLALAYTGAWATARRLGGTALVAALAATAWCTLPLVWNHAGYSMLALGFAFLPLYAGTVLALLSSPTQLARRALLFVATAWLAVFSDGYTFVMLAIAALVLWLIALATTPTDRRHLLLRVLPVLLAGLGSAFVAYTRYVGRSDFVPSELSVFRGWGVDVAFLLQPTHGTLWLTDVLHLGAVRTPVEQFGDESVWATTFALPLLAAGAWSAWQLRRQRRSLVPALILLTLFGLWMALGPSLKVGAIRPLDMRAHPQPFIDTVPPLWPTGNAWLSEQLPGFRNMRASYRWLGLADLGLWLLLVTYAGRPRALPQALVLALLILTNLPHPGGKLRVAAHFRDEFQAIDHELLADLRSQLQPHERVLFLPHGNDFLVNYAAAQLDIQALNAGGDKNKAMAAAGWPELVRRLPEWQLSVADVPVVAEILHQRLVDVVVIAHVNLLWAAHDWPCGEPNVHECPDVLRAQRAGVVEALAQVPGLRVQRGVFGTAVRVE